MRRGLALILFLAAAIIGTPASAGVQIDYLPFSIQTYRPVTKQTIVKSAFIQLIIKHQEMPNSVRALIKEEDHISFDNQKVRLRILDGQDSYFFDANGNGVLNKRTPVSIDVHAFENLISQNKIAVALSPIGD